MEQIVSITSQGQLTIPKTILADFGIAAGAKALIRKEGSLIIVEPKTDFWSLSGSLQSPVRLSDKQLAQARRSFIRKWSKER